MNIGDIKETGHVASRSGPFPGWSATAFLATLISLPSFALVQKYGGLIGVAVYFLAVMALLRCLLTWQSVWEPWLRRYQVPLGVVFVAGLVGIFAIGYPMEDGRGPGRSSDRDDGLNIAVARLMDGESPYYPPHPEAGPLSLLPGAVILAIPFSLLGNSAFQNFFWLGVWWWATARYFSNRALALFWIVFLFAVCPALQYEFISGGDMLSNGIYVPVLMLWASLRAERWKSGRVAWGDFLIWGTLGLALASRPNFLFLGPLFFTSVWVSAGWRPALVSSGIAGLVALGISAGYYWHDPQAFSPLVAGNKIASFDAVLPRASMWVGGLSVVVAFTVAVRAWMKPADSRYVVLFRRAVLVLIIPMLAGVILQSLRTGGLDFGFLHPRYGLMYLFASIWAWGGPFAAGELSQQNTQNTGNCEAGGKA